MATTLEITNYVFTLHYNRNHIIYRSYLAAMVTTSQKSWEALFPVAPINFCFFSSSRLLKLRHVAFLAQVWMAQAAREIHSGGLCPCHLDC